MGTRSAIKTDIARIQRIDAVPRLLEAVTRLCGMRFAAIARVTDTHWTACAVRDDLGFGLAPGAGLPLDTTLCNEIRQHRQPIVFGHASADPIYAGHPTPVRYGLESYLSVPIFRRDGAFWGTLCAIDSRPAALDDPMVLQTVELFAEMIGVQLQMAEDLDAVSALLQDARLRERLVAASEGEVRNLLQPAVTTLYLLRTSPTLQAGDKALVREMETGLAAMTGALRPRLDAAIAQVDLHGA